MPKKPKVDLNEMLREVMAMEEIATSVHNQCDSLDYDTGTLEQLEKLQHDLMLIARDVTQSTCCLSARIRVARTNLRVSQGK